MKIIQYYQLITITELVSDTALLVWDWVLRNHSANPGEAVELLRGVWAILEHVELGDPLIRSEAGTT